MQEEVEKKSIQLAVTTTKLSARMAAKGLAAYLRHRKAVKVRKATKAAQKPIGKQTV